MLLGPGEFLRFRKQLQKELKELGYKPIIMEDIEEKRHESGLDEKFERIMKQYDPRLFFAFFHKDTSMEAVIFEIGCICCKYGTHKIGKRLRLLAKKDYDWDKTTAYIRTLFSRTIRDTYDDRSKHYKASKRIHYLMAAVLLSSHRNPSRYRQATR
jgi:hypothetical protein